MMEKKFRNSRFKTEPIDNRLSEATEIRLQKFLSEAGVCSRRKAEELIQQGKIEVNGEKVTTLGAKVDPVRDKVFFEGRRVQRRYGNDRYVYYALNKPRGFITTVSDPEGRKTIYDLLDGVKERVLPVGRLDRDSEGLLILTNNGDLINTLTHPRFQIEKEYHVTVEGKTGKPSLDQLKEGVVIEGGYKTKPAKVEVLEERGPRTHLTITISEGKKRQVKQMFEALGFPVLRLFRVREGAVRIGDLRPGKFRKLTKSEILALTKKREDEKR